MPISDLAAAKRGSLLAARFFMWRVPLLLLAPLAVCLAASPLSAQETSPPSEAIELPEVTVSATTTPEPLTDVGSSVTVIDLAQIDREQRRTVPDALSLAPGLNVVQKGGPGGQTSVFVRGTSSNQVKVLIDGIDASDPSNPTGAFDFGQLLTYDIDRIEILRGPQSGLYGADAIGGVISITTKSGEGPPKAKALIEGGSFGSLNEVMGFSVTSVARKPAPYATLSAALYSRPGAASNSFATSSGLKTTGSFCGWWTKGKWSTTSGLRNVTMKRKRKAVSV